MFVLTAPGLGYVSLVLPADAPPEAADALEAVLEGLTAYGSAATGAAESAYGAAASAPPMAADQPGPSYTATQEVGDSSAQQMLCVHGVFRALCGGGVKHRPKGCTAVLSPYARLLCCVRNATSF